MAKKTAAPAGDDDSKKPDPVFNSEKELARRHEFLNNALFARSELLKRLMNMAGGEEKIDINKECGYPEGDVSLDQMREYYKREGIANRVVSILPEESWALDPEVFEVEDAEETVWEAAFALVRDAHNLWSVCQRVDEVSGICNYGVLLLGIGDGKTLDQPAAGLDNKGQRTARPEGVPLNFLRVHDQLTVQIDTLEEDETNPRYGKPVLYKVVAKQEKKIHWSRVIHVADNLKTDEINGVPRQEPCFNRLIDLRKLLGGSAQMFWAGGFPGLALEVNPDVIEAGGTFGEEEQEKVREQMERYQLGLQRYLNLLGMTAKSLAPQVADPRSHVDVQLLMIAVTIGVPLRVFLGTEEAKLASSQDMRTWNKRLKRRQTRYLTPQLIRPLVDRLIALGVLPEPSAEKTVKSKKTVGKLKSDAPAEMPAAPGYDVFWPDLFAPSEDDKATTITKIVDALAKYVAGGIDQLIPPLEFLTHIMGFELSEVEAFLAAAEAWISDPKNVANNPDNPANPNSPQNPMHPDNPASPNNPDNQNPRDKKGGE